MFNENNTVQQFITRICSQELGWRFVDGRDRPQSITLALQ
jgi:hypothetical protein